MKTAFQFLFARVPAAKEFFALCLLNLFLFVQLISFLEVVHQQSEKEKMTSAYCMHQQQIVKGVAIDKKDSLQKFSVLAVLASRQLLIQPPVSMRFDEVQCNFFLADQCSSPALKGRAPPLV